MMTETSSISDRKASITRKHLHQAIVVFGALIVAIQSAIVAAILLTNGSSMPLLVFSLPALGCAAVFGLGAAAAGGDQHARAVMDRLAIRSDGEPIAWDAEFPEVDG